MAKKPGKKKVVKATSPKTPKVVVRKSDMQEEPLTTQQKKALDEAVSFINTRLDKSATCLIEIGEYLLKNFFAGDLEKVQDRAPRKGVSLRKLAEHPDINISFAGLSNAVNLAVQEKQLASVQTSEHLTASHRILLLKVEDIQTKKEYITKVQKDKLSVRRFHELLEKDGLVQRRGLAAVEDEGQRKLLRSGYQSLMGPFQEILVFNIEKLLEMPPANIDRAYKTVLDARKKIDVIIKDFELKRKQ